MNNSKKGTLFRIDLKNSNEFIVARRTSLKLGTVFKNLSGMDMWCVTS